MADWSRALATRGFIVAGISYRLSDECICRLAVEATAAAKGLAALPIVTFERG